MDKPISLSMKDYLIRKLAVKLMTSEKTIEAVINHQFQSANEAMYSNKTVEISGFGKFIFNDKKAVKKMETYLKIEKALLNILSKPDLTESKQRATLLKMATTKNNITLLKPRIDENHQLFPDLRGVEKQPAAAQSVEENNKGDE